MGRYPTSYKYQCGTGNVERTYAAQPLGGLRTVSGLPGNAYETLLQIRGLDTEADLRYDGRDEK